MPDDVITEVKRHIGNTVDMLRGQITKQMVMSNIQQPQPKETQNLPPTNIPLGQRETINGEIGV